MRHLFFQTGVILIFLLLFGKAAAIQETDSLPKIKKYQKQFSFLLESGHMIT